MSSIAAMEQIVALAKHRGFIFPGSEIYGGLANTWDYGPLGVELKNNIKRAWWKKFIQESPYNVGLDAAILMNPRTWMASGHVGNFNDPMIDCKQCKARHRADKIIENALNAKGIEMIVDGLSFDQMKALIVEHQISCPDCGSRDFTDIRQFNLMFKTFQGVTESSSNEIYLRPETAQGIFVNFKSVQRTMRKRLPFGIGQIGKSFRNEITPGNFTFRTREFEQMELEFFCKPGEDLSVNEQESGERYIPYCIEPSLGADRVTLAFLIDAYEEQQLEGDDSRTVLRLHPALAPFKAAVFPLSKKLAEGAQQVYADLTSDFMVDYDDTGSIGKRYRRHDEIGTPYCITYDFESESDGQVTVRDRDSMTQVRMPITDLKGFLLERIRF